MKLAVVVVLLLMCACSSPDEVDDAAYGFAVDYKNETSDVVRFCLNLKGDSVCDTLEKNEVRNFEAVVDSIIHEKNCCSTYYLESFDSMNDSIDIYMDSEIISSGYNDDIGAKLTLYHVIFRNK